MAKVCFVHTRIGKDKVGYVQHYRSICNRRYVRGWEEKNEAWVREDAYKDWRERMKIGGDEGQHRCNPIIAKKKQKDYKR